MSIRHFTLAGLALVLAAGAASGSYADTPWQTAHPRREQVDGRLARQDRRITAERREGDLTPLQAAYLHAKDRGIRAQERFDASRHGGHLTQAEQHRLNREENSVSRQIGR